MSVWSNLKNVNANHLSCIGLCASTSSATRIFHISYLTANFHRHILSNVGRVAARDSSRTNATVNDLFVALCEDDSIYGLFRTMKGVELALLFAFHSLMFSNLVYEQIELMSKTPKSRRSRSFSRTDRQSSISRTSSPQQEPTLVNSSSGSRSRQSSEGQLTVQMTSSSPASRASFEKSRAIRMFSNSKGPDADMQSSHKRSASLRSENSRALPDDEISNPAEVSSPVVRKN